MTKNETPREALRRLSRKDFIKAGVVAGALGAMGVGARPRAAKAAIQRVQVGDSPQTINQKILAANSAQAPLIFENGTYDMGANKMADIQGIPYVAGETPFTKITFGNTGTSRAWELIGGGQGERALRVENLHIVGPAPFTVTKGQDQGTQIGISVGGDTRASSLHCRFKNVSVERFHIGIAIESMAGHIFFEHSGVSFCTFGYWMRRTTGNYNWLQCDDRTFSKAAYLFSRGELIEHGLRMGGHISHTPYVFYRTADVAYRSGTGPYLLRSNWMEEQVEWLGNSMAYSEVGGSGVDDCEFAYGSQTFSPSQIWPGRPKDWLWDVGYMRSTIVKSGRQWEAGNLGLIKVAEASKIAWEGRKPTNTTASGPLTIVDRSI